MARKALIVGNYEFGPVAGGLAALQWVAKKGTQLLWEFESPNNDNVGSPVTIFSVQVSPDAVTWANAVDVKGNSLANLTLNPGGALPFNQNLRPTLDQYLRIICPQGARTIATIRGDVDLDLMNLGLAPQAPSVYAGVPY